MVAPTACLVLNTLSSLSLPLAGKTELNPNAAGTIFDAHDSFFRAAFSHLKEQFIASPSGHHVLHALHACVSALLVVINLSTEDDC